MGLSHSLEGGAGRANDIGFLGWQQIKGWDQDGQSVSLYVMSRNVT